MNTITPMPIFIPASQPSTCPNCGKEEDIRRVCGHCGGEYKEEPMTTNEQITAIAVVIFVVWGIVSIFMWFVNIWLEIEPDTLLGVIKEQAMFFLNLKLW